MIQETLPTPPFMGHVRRRFWVLLVGALVLTLALPLVTLWRDAASPLRAQACLWPQSSQSRGAVQLFVTLPDATDRADVDGPWARVMVQWDMITMPMGTRHHEEPGSTAQAGSFAVPLVLDMAGPWWIDVRLQTPGRPEWHTRLLFNFLSSGTLPQSSVAASQATPAPLCPQGERMSAT